MSWFKLNPSFPFDLINFFIWIENFNHIQAES